MQSYLGSTYNQCTAFLDACGTGIFPRDMTRGVISSACRADEVSMESPSIGHGYFTYYLLSGLTQSNINTAEQLHNYAAPLTTQANPTQHPQLGDNFGGSLIIYNSNITLSGTLQFDEIWNTNVTLTGNVSVPSGITLTIKSGATINLNGYSIISNGGTISVESGATINGRRATLTRNGTAINNLYGTIQPAVNAIPDLYYGHSYDLYMSDGSFSETVNISNKYGLYFYGGPNSTTINGSINITNCESCTFSGFGANSVSLSGCTVPQLYNLNLNFGSGNQCLYAYNSTNLYLSGGDISDRYAYLYGTGFYINQSSTSTIEGTTGHSTFFNHNVRGVLAQGSTVNINNVCFCSNTYDLVAGSSSTITATNCWFPGAVASTSGTGINLWANQDFTNCSGLYKSSGNVVKSPAGDADSLADEFGQINNADFALAGKVRADISANKSFDKSKYRSDYLSVANSYNGFIIRHPASEYSKTALTSIVQNYKLLDDYDGMNNYLQTVLSDNNLKNENSLAKRFMIDYYSHQKDFTTAIKTADEILAGKDTNYICDALYAKGYIYSHNLNDTKAATACFSEIISNHSYNSLVILAKNELQLLGVDAEKIAKKSTTAAALDNSEISTSNYPNPFNPSTIISYQLPKDGFVTLKVYDVLGREVKTLVNEYKIQGKYEITFNGAGLASGVYYYQLRISDPSGKVNNSVVTKKILLMK